MTAARQFKIQQFIERELLTSKSVSDIRKEGAKLFGLTEGTMKQYVFLVTTACGPDGRLGFMAKEIARLQNLVIENLNKGKSNGSDTTIPRIIHRSKPGNLQSSRAAKAYSKAS